ncbi:MAG: M16 family metallopeptidase, partial [Armatimonadota bacterium]
MIPEPPIQPAPLAHTRRRLPNGLDVIAAVRSGTGTVAVQVWYKVGGKDDPAGRSGFAHLFEHLMFKRTRNLPDEGFDRLTEDVGGENNAYTTPDTTVYHEVVPSEHLETILWAEAERLANLQVTERVFLSERDVVKEEYRQGVLAPPYGRFDDAIERTAWGDHPYQRTVIGNLPELDAARVEEAKAFHAAWYRPDNAVLVVAGDFVPSDADRWIDRYFGRIPAPARAIGRMSNPVAERTSERRVGVPGPNVPLPAVAVTYGTPAATASGTGTLQLLDALLASGKSSRLFRELVYRRRTASEVGSWLDLRTDGGTLVLRAVASEKTSAQRLEDDLHDVA